MVLSAASIVCELEARPEFKTKPRRHPDQTEQRLFGSKSTTHTYLSRAERNVCYARIVLPGKKGIVVGELSDCVSLADNIGHEI